MRVTLAQLDARPTVPENLAVITEIVHASRESLVVFPELALNGYDLDEVASTAMGVEALAPVAEAARAAKSAAVVGFAELVEGGIANSAAVLAADGSLTGIYRKTHLFGVERRVFAAGSKLMTFWLPPLRIGTLVCFDMEFPDVARTLARRGAAVLVTISANMEPFGPDHDTFVRARALETHLPHIYVNRVGAQMGFEFTGQSRVVRSDGSVAIQLSDREEVVTVDIDDADVDSRVDYLGQLRPELYE